MLSGGVASPTDRVDSTQFSMDELRAIVEEAAAANIYVAGHAYTSRAINRGLEAGVRSIEHGNLMDASSIPLFQHAFRQSSIGRPSVALAFVPSTRRTGFIIAGQPSSHYPCRG